MRFPTVNHANIYDSALAALEDNAGDVQASTAEEPAAETEAKPSE